jgi:hypothetical protein
VGGCGVLARAVFEAAHSVSTGGASVEVLMGADCTDAVFSVGEPPRVYRSSCVSAPRGEGRPNSRVRPRSATAGQTLDAHAEHRRRQLQLALERRHIYERIATAEMAAARPAGTRADRLRVRRGAAWIHAVRTVSVGEATGVTVGGGPPVHRTAGAMVSQGVETPASRLERRIAPALLCLAQARNDAAEQEAVDARNARGRPEADMPQVIARTVEPTRPGGGVDEAYALGCVPCPLVPTARAVTRGQAPATRTPPRDTVAMGGRG